MKTSLLVIIVGLSVAGIFGGLYTANVIKNIEDQKTQEQWRENRVELLSAIKNNKTDSGRISDEDSSSVWVSLPMTSHRYPWHGSNHPEYDLHFEEYKSRVKDYDSSAPQDVMLWFHYLIVKYYEGQGITVFDVKTSKDSSLTGTDVDGTPHLGATWHLKISPSDLDYFLDNGFSESEVFSFCGADGFDSKGNPNTDNSTHHWDENECTWLKIVSFDDPVYSIPFGLTQEQLDGYPVVDPIYVKDPNNPEELILDIDSMQLVQKILKDCGPPKYKGFAYGLEYSNGTHVIDNNTCEWRKIK